MRGKIILKRRDSAVTPPYSALILTLSFSSPIPTVSGVKSYAYNLVLQEVFPIHLFMNKKNLVGYFWQHSPVVSPHNFSFLNCACTDVLWKCTASHIGSGSLQPHQEDSFIFLNINLFLCFAFLFCPNIVNTVYMF